MPPSKKEIVSAQVIVIPFDGKPITGRTIISGQNISDFVPEPKAVSAVTEIFRARGFDVGPIVGISFSITAPLDTFENFLSTTVRHRRGGGFEFFEKERNLGSELRHERLPGELKDYVHVIAFPLPPDFGPTEW